MESKVDIRITPFTNLRRQPKISLANNRDRFTHFNKPAETKPKRLLLSVIPTNKTSAKKLNNIFELSKNTTITQPGAISGKKGLLLYQRIERDKLFSNGLELINRFDLKA